MECAQCQLSPRLTDALCSDDTDGLTDVDDAATGQIPAVTGSTDTSERLAGKHRPDPHLLKTSLGDRIGVSFLE